MPHLIRPVMTSLVHDRTHVIALLFLSVIKDLPNSRGHGFLEQHPPPTPCLSHTLAPSAYLSFIVLASATHVEATIPLEPASDITCVIDPASSFPLFYGLSTGHLVFVHFWVVARRGQELPKMEARDPRLWQLLSIVGNCSSQSSQVE